MITLVEMLLKEFNKTSWSPFFFYHTPDGFQIIFDRYPPEDDFRKHNLRKITGLYFAAHSVDEYIYVNPVEAELDGQVQKCALLIAVSDKVVGKLYTLEGKTVTFYMDLEPTGADFDDNTNLIPKTFIKLGFEEEYALKKSMSDVRYRVAFEEDVPVLIPT